MTPKRKTESDDFFAMPLLPPVPRFGSGQVAAILGVELWQLNRFLARYELSSSGQLGEGRGSRRMYTTEDVCRIKTAIFLITDGFAPKLVARMMQMLEDTDFYGSHDEEGDLRELGISLSRGEKGPEVTIFRADNPPEISTRSKTYYALDLSSITRWVDHRIAMQKKR
jgi:DNA-binding transcriptional MerR regulator